MQEELDDLENINFSEEYDEERNEELLQWDEDYLSESPSSVAESSEEKQAFVINESTSPEAVLKHYWGYDSFRPLQREIIGSVLQGQDTLALLPTGGGKSICFQVPALLSKGITIVVTPLISLMKDQVDNLRKRGVKAMAIHSGMKARQINQAIDNCIFGRYKLLYVSPERLGTTAFQENLQKLKVGMLVIDECHCICQWGYDFRPSYLNIKELRELLPDVPVLALTATATPDVVLDIQEQLGFDEEAKFFQQSFYRPNLSYSLRRTNDKEAMMLHILSRVAGSSIVYCRSRKLCGTMAKFLRDNGISATAFHAGLSHTEREMRQNRWINDEIRVMVATNAFGMGIDKPDVRLVIHFNLPSSLEEYFQEAGRAGRDGEQSYAVLLNSERDASMLKRRFTDSFPKKSYIHKTYEALCNYFAIGMGEGFQCSYDFELEPFIWRFRLHPVQTRHAISIMETASWLSYKEDDTRSRLKFVYTREELYQDHVGYDQLLRAILRLYSGLFADYVFIQEEVLAKLLSYTQEDVYAMLIDLDRRGILHYIPRKNIPRIQFHIRREPVKYLMLPPSAYEERKERMRQRIEAGINYILEHNVCRSQLLLAYFGEQSETKCGMCDVCLRRKEVGLQQYIIDETEEIILKLIDLDETEEELILKVEDVCEALPHAPTDVVEAIRYLANERGLYELQGNLILPNY